MSDLEFFLEYGITPETFQTLSKAAQCITENGDPEKVYLVLFNQVRNQCSRNNLDHRAVFESIIAHLRDRLNSPQTPQEFFDTYGDDET
jgi:hypothetical protein